MFALRQEFVSLGERERERERERKVHILGETVSSNNECGLNNIQITYMK